MRRGGMCAGGATLIIQPSSLAYLLMQTHATLSATSAAEMASRQSRQLCDSSDVQQAETRAALWQRRQERGCALGVAEYGKRAAREAVLCVRWREHSMLGRVEQPPGEDLEGEAGLEEQLVGPAAYRHDGAGAAADDEAGPGVGVGHFVGRRGATRRQVHRACEACTFPLWL